MAAEPKPYPGPERRHYSIPPEGVPMPPNFEREWHKTIDGANDRMVLSPAPPALKVKHKRCLSDGVWANIKDFLLIVVIFGGGAYLLYRAFTGTL